MRIFYFLFLAVSFFVHGQESARWKKVHELESNGKIKSAYEKVNQIYSTAKRKGDEPGRIKALLYQSRYLRALDLKANPRIISNFEAELNSLSPASKALLAVAYARLLRDYSRSYYNHEDYSTRPEGSTDLTTWSSFDISERIKALYELALESSRGTGTRLKDYGELFLINDVREFEIQTVYDYVLFKALEYYTTLYRNHRLSAVQMKDILAPTERFLSADFSAIQPLTLRRTLQLFQEAERKDGLSARLLRLNYAQRWLDTPLKRVLGIMDSMPAPDDAHLHQRLLKAKYQILENPGVLDNGRLLAISDSIIALKRGTTEYAFAYQKRTKLLEKVLWIDSESFIGPDQISKIRVSYRNVDTVRIRFYRIPFGKFRNATKVIDSARHYVRDRPADYEMRSNLPVRPAYQESTEVILPPLERGYYIVTTDSGSDIPEVHGLHFLTVTSLVAKQIDEVKIRVLDRNTGFPVSDVSVTLDNLSEGETQPEATDSGGETLIPAGALFRPVILSVAKDGDTLQIRHPGTRGPHIVMDTLTIMKLYTDRAIYRPGQVVKFKGILMRKWAAQWWVLPDVTVKIALKNTNGEEVDTVELTSNQFGSLSDEFKISIDGLTGQYTLWAGPPNDNAASPFWQRNTLEGSCYFKVEEYKRPEFEMRFDPVRHDIIPNVPTSITGVVLSFSGAPVAHAEVRYSVRGDDGEVAAFGTIHTDADGRFTIPFIPPDKEGTDAYAVDVEVTDLSGRTQTGKTFINASRTTLRLNIEMPSKVEPDHLPEVAVVSTNLNNQPKPAKAMVRLYKNAERTSMRSVPVTNIVIPDREYKKHFPFHRAELAGSLKPELIDSMEVDTGAKGKIPAAFFNRPRGAYHIRVSAFDNKDTVAVTEHFLIDRPLEKPDSTKFVHLQQLKTVRKPGHVSVRFMSVVKELYLDVQCAYASGEVIRHSIVLNGDETFEFPSTSGNPLEEMLVDVIYRNIHDTERFHFRYEDDAPLGIEASTFRSKIEPGSKQKWIFKLMDRSSTAEILAGMYDSSLDKLSPLHWAPPRFYFPRIRNLHRVVVGSATTSSRVSFPTYRTRAERSRYEMDVFGLSLSGNYSLNAPSNAKRGVWGTVTDSIGPIPGVRVNIVGSKKATYTDIDGRYSIDADRGQTLQFSYVGMLTKELKVAKKGRLDVALRENPVGWASETVVAGAIALRTEATQDDASDYGFATMKVRLAAHEKSMGTAADSVDYRLDDVVLRRDLAETAFFFPHIQSKNGQFSIEFTAPEALTAWKLRLMAHTKDLRYGFLEKITQTSKELMVVPNLPRFLRESDTVSLMVKIANPEQKLTTGTIRLELFDASTMEKIPLNGAQQTFKLKEGQTAVTWTFMIPRNIEGLQYKVIAASGRFSDGEEGIIPVLPDNILVTETAPIWVDPGKTQSVTLESVPKAVDAVRLALRYNSNLAWSAIEALPYLITCEHDCSEQTFARYFALKVGQAIRAKHSDFDARLEQLKSNAGDKPDLSRTPWKRHQSNDDYTQRLGNLLDKKNLEQSAEAVIGQLKCKQSESGGFSWFPGGKENVWVTAHILSGLGKLDKMLPADFRDEKADEISRKAITFLDEYYLTQRPSDDFNRHWSWLEYVYSRSFYLDTQTFTEKQKEVWDSYLKRLANDWLELPIHHKPKAALALHRSGYGKQARAILTHLRESSALDDTYGMYWVENVNGYAWHQASVETHADIMEAFHEISGDKLVVEQMRKWLLRKRKLEHWPTTKSTTAGIYALLAMGEAGTSQALPIVTTSDASMTKTISEAKDKSGDAVYLWSASEIKPTMQTVSIANKGKEPVTGGFTFEYYQKIEEVASHTTGDLGIKKTLFKKSLGSTELQRIVDQPLNVGDLLVVRLELTAKETIDYVHVRDSRPAGFEPVDVISGRHTTAGQSYYKTTGDVATQMFFDRLEAGTYIVEYEVRVNNAGNFSSGIATIQSMYAPEFSAHTKGQRIVVK